MKEKVENLVWTGALIVLFATIVGYFTIPLQTGQSELKQSIENLSSKIDQDRRAMTQRIDHLYQSKVDKKSK